MIRIEKRNNFKEEKNSIQAFFFVKAGKAVVPCSSLSIFSIEIVRKKKGKKKERPFLL
jgi:hypothetical protein